MRQPLGHPRKEREYFYEVDADLLDDLRRHDDSESRRSRMAEACQIQDERVLDALERLGYDPSTVTLLHLVPPIQVAWADGSVNQAERERIVALAAERGVNDAAPGYAKLLEWLDHAPSDEFFEGTLSAIEAGLVLQPLDVRRASRQTLLQHCREVAFASCGHFGWRNKICIFKRWLDREIARRLQASGPAAGTPAGGAAQGGPRK